MTARERLNPPAVRLTQAESSALLSVSRKREKVAKTAARHRSAELLAMFERDMQARYQFADDATWSAAMKAAKDAVDQGNVAVANECKRLGIPQRFAPRITIGWDSGGENSNRERAQLRLLAKRQVDAQEMAAFEEIERVTADIQTKIVSTSLGSDAARHLLEQMPTAERLMPPLRFGDVKALLGERNEDLHHWERIEYSGDEETSQ